MDLVWRNIAILFDDKLTGEFIRLSQKINKKVSSDIILNSDNMFPHATIYTTNFPMHNEEKIIDSLRKITSKISPFGMQFTQPVVDMLGVWINAERTPEVEHIHEIIVDELNNFREGQYDAKELITIGENKERQESLVKYGMWAAKSLYIPHVTLSRPKDSSRLKEALSLLPKKVNYKARISEIAYVERGPFGTCKKILQRFPLKD